MNKQTKKTTISKTTTYKLINALLFIGIISLVSTSIFFSNKVAKNIQSKKQQILNQEASQKSQVEQTKFFEDNPNISETISKVLPNQDSIIEVVDSIESLQKSLGIPQAFDFTSIVPTKDVNSSYVSFIIKTNTTMTKSVSFLRAFEKLPYLIKITSINIKTPEGIGGPIELSISARIYVQDPF